MSKKKEIKLHPAIQAIIYFVTTFIACMIIWPLLDLLWCNVFTHSEFQYNFWTEAAEAAVIAAVLTLVFFLPTILKQSKKEKSKK